MEVCTCITFDQQIIILFINFIEFDTVQGKLHDTIKIFGPEFSVSVQAKITDTLGSFGNLFRISSESRGFGIYQRGGSTNKDFRVYYYVNGGSKQEFDIPYNFNTWYKLTITQTLLAGKVPIHLLK